jgi:hypothetical protein
MSDSDAKTTGTAELAAYRSCLNQVRWTLKNKLDEKYVVCYPMLNEKYANMLKQKLPTIVSVVTKPAQDDNHPSFRNYCETTITLK